MNISRLYVLINHIHHIIILVVYNFLAIMNKTTKIQKLQKVSEVVETSNAIYSNTPTCGSFKKRVNFFCKRASIITRCNKVVPGLGATNLLLLLLLLPYPFQNFGLFTQNFQKLEFFLINLTTFWQFFDNFPIIFFYYFCHTFLHLIVKIIPNFQITLNLSIFA
jgi:hypothetical protein